MTKKLDRDIENLTSQLQKEINQERVERQDKLSDLDSKCDKNKKEVGRIEKQFDTVHT